MRSPSPTSGSFGRGVRELWPLDPGITYLNHGTVGVTPTAVLDAQEAMRREIERNPAAVLLREVSGMLGEAGGESRLRRAAARVAAFVGAEPRDLAFVGNATEGVNAVLGSLGLGPGDAILATEKTYGGVRQAIQHACDVAGAEVQVAALPCPISGPDEIVAAVTSAITPATRLAVLDHIVSELGAVLPVAELAAACRARGVRVLVDGAHAPGQLELDLPALGADYYAANLHKWAHAPRSSAFLWVRRELQEGLHPPVVSWNLGQGLAREFDWTGTRDVTPWLAAPAGIDLLEGLGFAAVRAYNHDLVWSATERLGERWGGGAAAPESMAAFMSSLQLPASFAASDETAGRLRDRLLFEHRIEVPVFAWHGRLWARLSAQVYNEAAEFDRLAEAVEAEAER